MPDGATGAQRLTMMEFGHFISVTVELACRAPNDGNICYCASGAPILLSISLKTALIVWQIALWTPVLETGKGKSRRRRRRRWKIGGENILYMFIYFQHELMENATAILIPLLFCRRWLQLREAVWGVRLQPGTRWRPWVGAGQHQRKAFCKPMDASWWALHKLS